MAAPTTVWSRWTTTNENSEKAASLTVRMEDIVSSEETRGLLLEHLGLRRDAKPFPQSNRGKSSSTFDSWTKTQRADFEAICGEMMDRHYPGWRSSW